MFLLWGLHNFWHQALSLILGRKADRVEPILDGPGVAILYMTCNDFDPEASKSCIEQTYANSRLVICDDSTDPETRRSIDEWAGQFPSRVSVIRRTVRRGYKAGNINHAIRSAVPEDFFVVCDADEILPPGFISEMLPHVLDSRVAFAQARHTARVSDQTRFARLLSFGIDLFYKHSLPLRPRYGFVSCFGHGIIVRRSAWEAIGGFPEIVSEDLGFAMNALCKGLRGRYVPEVVAQEEFPPTYTALMQRERKIVGGTIVCLQTLYADVIKSKNATFTEKADILLTSSFCFIGLITMINVVGGIWLAHTYTRYGYIGPSHWLLLLYMVGPLTPIVPLLAYLIRDPRRYSSFFLSSALAFASLMPVLGLKSFEQIFHLKNTGFIPTGQVAKGRQLIRNHWFAIMCGFLLVLAIILMPSPLIGPAVGISLMFMIGPVLCYTERKDVFGIFARNAGILPYIAIVSIVALTT